MNVVVHSFVADSSLSDCCDLVMCFGDLNWNVFQVGYPVDSPTNSALKQTPFGIPPILNHKVYEIALSEVLATQMGVTEAQHQSQLIWIAQIWPIFASQQVDSMGTRA